VRPMIIGVCLCLAVLPLLLLNGQVFTNGVLSLLFCLVAIVLCTKFAVERDARSGRTRAWAVVAILVILLAAGVVASLPSALRQQRNFNQLRERIRQLNHGER
jgi:hypothetical protein